jgi:rRNA-processing protein FCF1
MSGDGMADLVVNLSLLESTAGALSMLIEEFSNASKIVSASQGEVAEPTLVSALDDFANDWTVHRQDLLSSMEAVYKMATESHKAYIATDDKLAQDLRKQGVK